MWKKFSVFLLQLPPWAWNLSLAGAAVFSGLIFYFLLRFFLVRWAGRSSEFTLFHSLVHRLGKPLTIFIPLFVLELSMPMMHYETSVTVTVFHKVIAISLILSFAYILTSVVKVCEDYVIYVYDLRKENNLKERKIRTQLQFIRKLAKGLILLLTVCAILLSFDSMRRLGTGLLTGVGVSGVIVGFAAQRSLSNLLAGFQIAFTQPIRIDDVLVVEGEWGRVEEITLTYVVLKIWDERRLILPINYFIEKPFQNWTRNSSEIIGSAFFYVDYTAPIEEIRQEFVRLLQLTPLWDQRMQVMQVTNTTEQSVEIRVLMSAASSSIAFDLRCYIREKLVSFIQTNYPDSLPKVRVERNYEL